MAVTTRLSRYGYSCYVARRLINGKRHYHSFPPTRAGKAQAEAKDAELAEMQAAAKLKAKVTL